MLSRQSSSEGGLASESVVVTFPAHATSLHRTLVTTHHLFGHLLGHIRSSIELRLSYFLFHHHNRLDWSTDCNLDQRDLYSQDQDLLLKNMNQLLKNK